MAEREHRWPRDTRYKGQDKVRSEADPAYRPLAEDSGWIAEGGRERLHDSPWPGDHARLAFPRILGCPQEIGIARRRCIALHAAHLLHSLGRGWRGRIRHPAAGGSLLYYDQPAVRPPVCCPTRFCYLPAERQQVIGRRSCTSHGATEGHGGS